MKIKKKRKHKKGSGQTSSPGKTRKTREKQCRSRFAKSAYLEPNPPNSKEESFTVKKRAGMIKSTKLMTRKTVRKVAGDDESQAM